jgi:hypothetical protein
MAENRPDCKKNGTFRSGAGPAQVGDLKIACHLLHASTDYAEENYEGLLHSGRTPL